MGDCVRFGVVNLASPELQDLYNIMETDFQPLKLCKKVDDRLKEFENTPDHPLVMYCSCLRDMTIVRLLKQVAQVYQCLTIKRLMELAYFTTPHKLERVIVECARNNDMQVRIDHRTGTVRFGTDLAEAQRQDLPEGPHVQSMPSEQIRTQLMRMMVSLDGAIKTLYPDRNQIENQELRKRIVDTYHLTKSRVQMDLLQRHHIIEQRKENQEKRHNKELQDKLKNQEMKEKEKRKQEAARLKADQEARAKAKQEADKIELQNKQAQDRINQLKATSIGNKILNKMDEETIAKMDHEEIVARQVEELNKEKKELQVRLKAQEKKVDHLERAKRVVEIPMLKEQWTNEEQERIKNEKEQREMDMASKVRFERMLDDRSVYLESLIQERKQIFDKKLAEFQAAYEEEKAARLEARRLQRIEDRRIKWFNEKEAEENRRREEAERILEEKRKRDQEEAAKRQAELDAIAEKQRQREMEERERNSAPPDKYRTPARTGGADSWREREKQKDDKYRPRNDDDGPRRRDDDGPRRRDDDFRRRDDDGPRRRDDDGPRRDDRDGW